MSTASVTTRELDDDLVWFQECGPDRRDFVTESERRHEWYQQGVAAHVPQNAFLFDDEETALFDTLSPACGEELIPAVEDAVGDHGLDYLIVSHPDVPHAGNTPRLQSAFPEATLVGPAYGKNHELYRLGDAMLVEEGETLDIGSQTLCFHEGTFPDSAVHLWMSETRRNALFPVDWMGFPHMATECLACVEEYDAPVSVDRLAEFHDRVLFWYQYVDVEKVQREIDRLIDVFDPDAVYPAHGAPIREDAVTYMERMKTVVEHVATTERAGTLG